MDTMEKVAIGALAIGGILLMTKKAAAAEDFTCPYGDGLVFTSLEALQDHVRAAHPGERIPISIQWQGA